MAVPGVVAHRTVTLPAVARHHARDDLGAFGKTVEEALRLALRLEDSAGESHFQLVMENEADTPAAKLFQKLNEDDKDHSRRIRMYAERRGLNIYG